MERNLIHPKSQITVLLRAEFVPMNEIGCQVLIDFHSAFMDLLYHKTALII